MTLLGHLWPGGTFWTGFDAIWPNIAAAIILGPVAWFWKIRPHFRRQRAHRETTAQQLADLHTKTDTLHAKITESETPDA